MATRVKVHDATLQSVVAIKKSSKRVAPNFWKDEINRKLFFDYVETELNIKQKHEWYRVSSADIKRLGGTRLLQGYYKSSLFNALSSVYPHFNWVPWQFEFKNVPASYWDSLDNHRKYFDWYATTHNINQMDDWYNVPLRDMYRHGGYGLLSNYYRNNLFKALSTIYPEHTWLPWKFSKLPQGFWNRKENVVAYLQWFSDQCGIKSFDDWFIITRSQLSTSLLETYGGLVPLLSQFYPEYDWKNSKRNLKGAFARAQTFLTKVVQGLFRSEEMYLNYRHPDIVYPGSARGMELDIFIPTLRLAFEYQGELHYMPTPFFGTTMQTVQQRDQFKKTECQRLGITLIEVPFWWDRQSGSLIATIRAARPDLGVILPKDTSSPIPQQIPQSKMRFFHQIETFPDHLAKAAPFRVSLGTNKRGGHPKCRGCLQDLKNREEPRLEIRGTYTPPTGTIIPVKIFSCLKKDCLDATLTKYAARSQVYIPPFNNQIFVPATVQGKLNSPLPEQYQYLYENR